MNHAADGSNIDGAMENLPAASAEAADPALRGSNGQRNQQNKTEEAHSDVAAFFDVLPHPGETKGLVWADISKKMQTDVEESEQAKHAAEANEFGEIQELAQRCDGESDQQKTQSPVAREVLDEFDRIGGEAGVEAAIDEVAKGHEAKQKNSDFRPFAGEQFAKKGTHVSDTSSGPCRNRGWRPGLRSH